MCVCVCVCVRVCEGVVELAWCSGSVTECHATARDSIPSGNSVFTKLHILRKGQ